ncbi:uncharacterized protein LOC121730148 [Aricia agestis]|uniref:uncharacterized protein LOC121730148 n=1 Tax=Aricia agestis TaxID=91739 RepID=UPI001C206A25|nr:uncharacterized protein LOC121730148 [Aricia agestis]
MMKPYKRTDKVFRIQLQNASSFGKSILLLKEFSKDLQALWRHSSAFPTFFKLIGVFLLCLIVLVPLCYPIFVVITTYFTCKALFLSFWLDQHWRLFPKHVFNDAISLFHPSCKPQDVWKVREALSRGLLVVYSLATSVDYLFVIQSVLDG